MSASVCIATHHPSVGGGVGSMMRAVVGEAKDAGLRPALFFPSKSVSDALTGRPAAGLPCEGYHYRSIPYLHLLTYGIPGLTARSGG